MEFIAQDPAFFTNMAIIAIMFVVFYFFILRPQKREDKKRELFQSSLKKGDKIITAGGIHAVIVSLGEQKATLRLAEKVEVDFTRSSISRFQDQAKQELLEAELKGKK